MSERTERRRKQDAEKLKGLGEWLHANGYEHNAKLVFRCSRALLRDLRSKVRPALAKAES